MSIILCWKKQLFARQYRPTGAAAPGGLAVADFADGVDGFALRLEIDAGDEFGEQAGGKEDEGHHEKHGGDEDEEGVLGGDVDAHDFADDEEEADEEGDTERAEADFSEEVDGAREIAVEEFDGEEVEHDAEGAADAVVAGAVWGGDVFDGDFGDFGAGHVREGGDETVVVAVEGDVVEEVAAIGFEGGAEVVNIDAGDFADEEVGELGGDAAEEEAIDPFFSPAGDDVVAFVDFGDELGELVGVVLEVAIHGNDDVAAGVIEAGGECGGLAEVAAEVDDEDVGVGFGELAEAGVGVVLGAIVDVDDFVGFGVVFADEDEVAREGVVELLDGVDFVVHGDDHGEVGGGGGFVPIGGGDEGGVGEGVVGGHGHGVSGWVCRHCTIRR